MHKLVWKYACTFMYVSATVSTLKVHANAHMQMSIGEENVSTSVCEKKNRLNDKEVLQTFIHWGIDEQNDRRWMVFSSQIKVV